MQNEVTIKDKVTDYATASINIIFYNFVPYVEQLFITFCNTLVITYSNSK